MSESRDGGVFEAARSIRQFAYETMMVCDERGISGAELTDQREANEVLDALEAAGMDPFLPEAVTDVTREEISRARFAVDALRSHELTAR